MVLRKRRYTSTRLYGVISEKTVFFNSHYLQNLKPNKYVTTLLTAIVRNKPDFR
jgi:hypothetical protein